MRTNVGIINHKLIRVQPIESPPAAIFYLDFLYDAVQAEWQRYKTWMEWSHKFSDCRGPRTILEILPDPSWP